MSAVTMADVAVAAGVSVKTVSNVLAEHPGVREETRARVLTAVDALGYRLNPAASRLRSGRTGVIAFALPHLYQPYFGDVAERVIAEGERHGYTVVIEPTDALLARERAVLSGGRAQQVDGAILSPAALGVIDLQGLHVEGPVVLLGARLDDPPADQVVMDDRGASRTAVAHLLAAGRTRIAAVGTTQDGGSADEREAGYRDALTAAGVPVDPALLLDAPDWDRRSSGAAAAVRLLDSGAPFDAVFCFNDAMAFGVLRVLASRGLRVPEDVAVVGFDNTEQSRFSTPPLTSVDPGQEQIARTAVDLLVRRIEGRTGAPEVVVADHHLVVRESSGGPRTPVV
ncbi:LacI family DNA-binding transcriptional regulator [Cellulomonas triticagri]|nr:LacI family DNA-binding transcriptional regulator [Cellulomonas triticagri]